ncbi:SDR family oxidoreductase [Vibrio anguillarum]|uniref:SDR family oxidoreductase n=2 Tax=Vibrio anguillarum TaxID=55601 RepID=A0ABD4QW20_VIBAN|nr:MULTISPECIES: SDR family oxidoreductase [Vibrio]MBF4244730.1 SDR family oxidoreductase [Vibrio anguillarum]MBT2919445.1 SDR family oxidoreductase [Vibrio anguillarum]OEE75534.1 short-chain dehydrogenase [Vibrio ordalii FF-167]
MSDKTLLNKTVVVVGGTSGLGFATAKAAICSGSKVIIGGTDYQKLNSALTLLGTAATGRVIDVTDESSVSAFFAPIDVVDHLVISAAILRPGSFLEASIEDLRVNLDSRFWGSVYCIRAAVPKMGSDGSITLTSGMVTQRPQASKALPAVAAGAVETLARSLVAELAPKRINVINPGPMRTPLLLNALGHDEQRITAIEKALPLKRLGEPEDYAQAALFLMTNANMNGEALHLNGGSAWA